MSAAAPCKAFGTVKDDSKNPHNTKPEFTSLSGIQGILLLCLKVILRTLLWAKHKLYFQNKCS